MAQVIPFRPQAVPLLWSPRKGVRAAWRIGAQPQVLPLRKAESGDAWHRECKRLMRKYGSDWNSVWGFPEHRATDAELEHVYALYEATKRARRGQGVHP